MLTITKSDAKAQGFTYYYTGKPCIRGHDSPRWVCDGHCVKCKDDKLLVRRGTSLFKEGALRRKARHEAKKPGHNTEAARRYKCKDNCPPWTDLQALQAVYAEAARLTEATGIPHEVDHVVPLRHPQVCGLHVPWNLEVKTMEANRSKHNRFKV